MSTDGIDDLSAALADRYAIERELGRGGMATVYLARDLRHDRPVALKVLHSTLSAALGTARFLREIQLTSRLQHPHILPLFDSGEAAGRLWFTMPYVDAGSLRQRLDREGPLPLSTALELTRDVASALDHAHRHGIVHRDVKPENILLHGGEAMLADFGVAHALGAAGGERLTETGITIGTPWYMSPEQATGDGALDGRSDIYSLGCVLYEMLAGEPPFTGATAGAVLARALTQPPPALAAVREVPAAVDALVSRALARAPDDRFASAADLTSAIDAGLAFPTVGSRPGRRSLPRFRWGASLVAVGVIAAVAWLLHRGVAETPTNRALRLDPTRVAVGAFENQTNDTTLGSLGRMAADWVARGLARTGVVDVLDPGVLYAQTSIGPAEHETPVQLARRNGAGLVVSGQFYRSADSILFTASVIDASTGTVVRSLDAVGAPSGRALAAVEELRRRLASALAASTQPGAGEFIAPAAQPPTYEAYREFVAAQEEYWGGQVRDAVGRFRRALQMDSTFLTAAVWEVAGAATINRCALADSVGGWLDRYRDRLAEADQATVDGSRARCDGNWTHSADLMRRRAAFDKGSTVPRWSLAANLRRSRRPAEAASILRSLDPARDLGWMSDDGKVMYWRELLWSDLMLGDTAAAARSVVAMARMAPGRLATAYFASLTACAAGRLADVLHGLDGVEAKPPDPSLLIGELTGPQRPERMATPGWVLYQLAAELSLRGDSADGRALARRAITWLVGRPPAERAWPESRYVLALALQLAGQVDSAMAVIRPIADVDREEPEYLARLGVLRATAGDRAGALEIEARLVRFPPVHPVGGPQLARAEIAAALGDRREAIELLQTLPFGDLPVDAFLLRSDPAFASIRSEASWRDLTGPGY
jgi:TolB-like protein